MQEVSVLREGSVLLRPPPPFAVASWRGMRVVLAATAAMAMGFGGLALFSVFMRPMEADLGWSRSDASLGYAFATMGMAVGGLVWGRLSDSVDVRLLLTIGGVGMGASLLAMAGLNALIWYYVASLIYGGLGFSVLYSPLISTSAEWFPRHRGLVMGVVTAGGAVGQGLLPFAANLLIEGLGWRAAFVGVAGGMAAVLAGSLPALRWPDGTRAPSRSVAGSRADLSRDQRLRVLLLGAAAFLCCMCMGVPLVHMVTYVGAICGSPAVGVTGLVVAMVCGAAGRVCFGVMADRIGALASYAIASATQTVCVLLFPVVGGGFSVLVLAGIFGIGFAGNMTCVSLCVRQAVPADRFGGALGAVMMVAWAGMAAGGYIGGLLFDVTGSYTLAFLLAGIAGGLNLLTLVALKLRIAFVPADRSRAEPAHS